MKKWLIQGFLIIITILPIRTVQANEQAPILSCQGCILMEAQSGRVLYEKNAHTQLMIASITKIMTALIAIEEGNLNEYVTIREEATKEIGSSIYVKSGEEIKLIDLIYGLMLRSGNDAAYAIAQTIGEGDPNRFIYLMNERAKAIGMKNTVFQNASGLDEKSHNLSTAYDMALLMKEALNNPIYKLINNTSKHRAETKDGRLMVFHNKHRLINSYEFVTGGKTGYTQKAKRTLVTSASKNNLDLIVVTLNDPNDWSDHMRLLNYGFDHYQNHLLFDKGILYVKELDQLFNLEEDIRYPLSKNELKDCEFIIDERDGEFYLRLMHGEHILLSRELVDYNYLHDDFDTFKHLPLGEKIKELFGGWLW